MPAETQTVAEYVARARLSDLPEAVRHEGVRAFLNWLGCTLGGCRHEIVETVDRTLGEFSGPAASMVIGRSRRYDVFLASCLNCISSSVYTFDDTHAEAIVHPTGPAASAVFALAERNESSGADVLLALCLGVEIECRLSKAISVLPARGSIAWSQTGICGGVGAAVAAGKLLGLSAEQMGNAIGIATSQGAGFRAMHATMNLHLMHGRTAPSGLRAALLAKNGLTSSPVAIEGHFGFAEVFSEAPNLVALAGSLGETFELLANTYKPYPCGIVINPVIDACVALRQRLDGDLGAIANIRIEVCQAAQDLCYRRKPQRPLDAQVSLSHWAAVALARGRVSINGYDAATLSDPNVHSLQDRMDAVLNSSLQIDQAIVTITLKDGRILKESVEHCVGSQARPMTDQQLEDKYRSQAMTVMPGGRVEKLATLCWQLAELSSVEEIVRTLS